MAKAAKQVRKPNGKRPAALSDAPDRLIEQRIRERAYQLYVERGEIPGDAVNDWLRAEREVIVAK